MMPATRRRSTSSHSESVEDVEMEQRRASNDQEQQEHLLPNGNTQATKDPKATEDWDWETIRAILLSILTIISAFGFLVLYSKYFVVKNGKGVVQTKPIQSFKRPESEYILDPNWNFVAAPTIRRYTWVIKDTIANPDGVFKPLLTVNGQFPGPVIECNEGDTIRIDVDNQSVNGTSIHFHGIFQNGTNWMDGTAGITQCPIAPKKKFRYEFTIKGQSGTYYYHGHHGVQSADGLFGPLIVHAKDEKKLQQIPYSSDRVLMLQDYYHDLGSKLLMSALEPGSETPPIPNGALINGRNSRDCSKLPLRLCDNSTANVANFDLKPNANHRLRILNVGSLAWFKIAIDSHALAITEADGTDLIPSSVKDLDISPAQRYSVVIRTNQTTLSSFWFRAKMLIHCWADVAVPDPEDTEIRAIINYKAINKPRPAEPISDDWISTWDVPCIDMPTSTLVPITPSPFPFVAHYSYPLRLNLEIGSWTLMRGFFNQSSFRPDLRSPILHRTIDGLSSGNSSFTSTATLNGPNTLAYDKTSNWVIQHDGIKVVDLIIQNFDEGSHPLHLHGHKFWVLGQAPGPFPGYSALGFAPAGRGLLDSDHPAHKSSESLSRLLQRDVASVEGYGWIALRFVADNPGAWAFHCHMLWHSEAGLSMVFLDRVDAMREWVVPEGNRKLCEVARAELEKGAAPKDEIWEGWGVGR